MAIPPLFNEEFLLWFRARTEACWKTVPLYSADADLKQEDTWGKWHPDWRGAKWLEPLPGEEIEAIEHQWHFRFLPDYRLFYK